MNKRAYIQENKDWLVAKSKEEGVRALPKGVYYKVLNEGDQSSAQPTADSDGKSRQQSCPHGE